MLDEHGEELARAISRLCGWVNFITWSIALYSQPILNFKRRTARGLAPDYLLLNIVGCACYTISTAAFLFSPVIRAQYAARYPASSEPTVRFNDFAFSLHGWILTVVTFSQFWPKLWGWKEVPANSWHISKAIKALLWVGILWIAMDIILVLSNSKENINGRSGWAWIDVVYAMAFIKLILVVIRSIPQIVLNYQRKSTAGWSIDQIILGVIGSIASLMQLLIDSSLQADWSGLIGNSVKFGLAVITILCDVVFLMQHYTLYGPVAEKGMKTPMLADAPHGARAETEPLLG